MSSPKPPKQKPREDRLKAALKTNMARRKAQARARGEKNTDVIGGKNKDEKAG